MKTALILLFDEVEVLDFAGPFEVFAVASELHSHALFDVKTVASELRPIRAVNGLSINPDQTVASAPQADVLIIPGGAGSRSVMRDKAIVNWVRDQSYAAEKVLSICSGARILATADLLDGLTITTHHEVMPEMPEYAPGAICLDDVRFTDNGQILTSAGISAGIDLSLYVVGQLCGIAVAEKTAAYMEYDWRVRRPGQSSR
ncbi:MAG: DJ-1/PfpI family protein [Formivibrio sp.]|nr:DJ-1/PfpI family protein [Formivibrio sp.]